MGSWMAPAWGLITRETKPQLEAWNFELNTASSREWQGTGNGS